MLSHDDRRQEYSAVERKDEKKDGYCCASAADSSRIMDYGAVLLHRRLSHERLKAAARRYTCPSVSRQLSIGDRGVLYTRKERRCFSRLIRTAGDKRTKSGALCVCV